MTTPALNNIAKIFGGLRAVDGVSFEVAPRQIFGLIGPNGAGKTTAFNCISGVYTPEQGTISFFGKSIAGRPPSEIAALGIARTFQNIRLFGDMTVLENVMVAGHATIGFGPLAAMFRLRKQAEEQERLAARAHELLRIFELDGLAGEFSKSLPYGSPLAMVWPWSTQWTCSQTFMTTCMLCSTSTMVRSKVSRSQRI